MKLQQSWYFRCWLTVCLLCHLVFAKDFVPKVTRTSSQNGFDIQAFDDSTILLKLEDSKVHITHDNGVSWSVVNDIKENAQWVWIDKSYKKERAIVSLMDNPDFYLTDNRGQSWKRLHVKDLPKTDGTVTCSLDTHGTNSNYLLIGCTICEEYDASDHKGSSVCRASVFVSNDGGNIFNEIKPISTPASDARRLFSEFDCRFAKDDKSSELDVADETILCNYKLIDLEAGEDGKSMQVSTSEFFTTTNWGKTKTIVEDLKDTTLESFQVLKNHIVAITQLDRYNDFSPKKLWVSQDAKTFKEAYLPTQVRYTVSGMISEDSIGRIILPISVMGGIEKDKHSNTISEILVSDFSGVKFSPIPWTQEQAPGLYHLQVPSFLKGTMMATFYSTAGRHGMHHKQTKSVHKISTDNGLNWSNLKVVDDGNKHLFSCNIDDSEKCSLHTMFLGAGDMTPTAGILMTVGVVSDGKSLNWEESMTFISRDGGLTWQVAFEYPVLYAFGDLGNIIIAVPFKPDEDDDPESEFYYSLDQGKTWTEYQLEKSIVPLELIPTTPDGSGSNFMLNGFSVSTNGNGVASPNFMYAIDFSEAYNGNKCKESDFESWNLADGKCVTGAKYSYSRRKSDAECLVGKVFEDLKIIEEPCKTCSEDDYECSFVFTRDSRNKCVPDKNLIEKSGLCSNSGKKIIQELPMQRIKGDKCKKDMDITPVDISCENSPQKGNDGDSIQVTENMLGGKVIFHQYFDTHVDESLIIGTSDMRVFVSHDGGQTIKEFDTNGDQIVEIVFNPYFNSSAYLFGKSGTLYITHDRGNNFKTTQLPDSTQLSLGLAFHAKDPNRFIYYGGKSCDSMFNPQCHAVAYLTTDGGLTFTEMLDNAVHCEFVGSKFENPVDEDLIMCQLIERGSRKRTLVSSKDNFQDNYNVLFDSIIGYMSTGQFIVVAVPHEKDELRAFVTADGEEFAEAEFPHDVDFENQEGFTVLGSATSAIFLHLSTDIKKEAEYGRLLKSNSNGTSFVVLEQSVNRDAYGYVDFEKVQGLEGIILVNTVSNTEEVLKKNEEKKLKTKITFNDGSDWNYLKPPVKDSVGKKYSCSSSSLEKCSLHLHGFTERKDIRDSFASGSALGMMIGVGNVGDHLLPFEECSTFLTTDAGATWKEVKKGSTQWEYGDHGGVLVLVPDKVATNTLTYSIDSGKTWMEYKFCEEKVYVRDIDTVPQDSAMRFLIVAESTSVRGASTKLFTLDFSKKFSRQCVYDIHNEGHDDFSYVSFNPVKKECLFGHQAEYLRKNKDDCFVGNVPLLDSMRIIKNCSCTRNDYECDYNFYKDKDGTCKLVKGLSPAVASDVCKKNKDLIEYFEPSGYRKIPLSTCKGGLKLDTASDPFPCPGKEKEFNAKYGISGISFSLLFLVPFTIVAAVAYVVYDRGIRRNGGFARFGEIRLGDNELIENNRTDRAINSVVRAGLYAVGSLYAVYTWVKKDARNIIPRIRARITGRRDLDYSSLAHDRFLDSADDLLAGHDEDADDLGSFMDHDIDFNIDAEENSQPKTTEGHTREEDMDTSRAAADVSPSDSEQV